MPASRVVVIVTFANCWANEVVAQKYGDRLPEIPKSTSHGLSARGFRRQRSKDDKHENRRDDLENHKLGNWKMAAERLRDGPFAAEELRHLEDGVVPHVMKYVVGMRRCHFHSPRLI